ncbi:peptide chain release factor N(5)-glutamine methyltransferase [Yeosuana sp.]|uniref:peptide chain release factor N(5)-glutamine methyltransferase n=1 Tax=Yeosuana sp. TaxID=2529388 RepID=UPI004054BEDA
MKLKKVKDLFQKELKDMYDKEEIDSFFYMLLESYLGLKRIQLALNPELSYPEKELYPIYDGLKKLKQNIPIQYIIGETEFYGLRFKVNKDVLIPRPETEELVQWIINQQPNSKSNQFNILDIGTGSGCIAISLAKNLPNAKVYALDISKKALKVAKINAKFNLAEVTFIEANILDPQTWNIELKKMKFDIIVSNPPYVREQEKEQMKDNVLKNEPHLALFVENNDPLQFYKAISQFAVNNLSQNGSLYFEINEYLGKQMKQLLNAFNFRMIELKQDIFGKDRMIKGIK